MAEAKLNKDYARRMLGVGAVMLALSAWSVYDGTVAWPRVNRQMETVRPALTATNLTAEAWLRTEVTQASPLQQLFAEQGLTAPRKLIKKMGDLRIPNNPVDAEAALSTQQRSVRKLLDNPIYSAEDLRAQFVQAGITLALALAAFGVVAVKQRRLYIADADGLHGSGFGRRDRAWDELRAIDWQRWNEKGIVVLSFATGDRVKCDGWHYAGMDGIVKVIETYRPDLCPQRDDGGVSS